jgi:hypothetical protein
MPNDNPFYKMDGLRNNDFETYNDLFYNKSNEFKSDRDYESLSYNYTFENNRRPDGNKRPGKKGDDEPSPTTKKSKFYAVMAMISIVVALMVFLCIVVVIYYYKVNYILYNWFVVLFIC